MKRILDKIERTPSYVEELKNYELEELARYIKSEKQEWLRIFHNLWLGNPDRSNTLGDPVEAAKAFGAFKREMLYHETIVKFDDQRELVRGEQRRRVSATAAPANSKGAKKSTTDETEAPTQKQLAVFYRTLQQLEAYPEFTENGRTMESHYKEIATRHNKKSPKKFKDFYREACACKSMGELVKALTFEVVESLVQTLPEKEKAMDLLKIEKAKG